MKRAWLILGWLWLFPGGVLAVDGGVGISPPFSNVVINSNDTTKKVVVSFSNNTGSLVSLRLKMVDFGALDESGGVAFLGVNKERLEKKYSLASWVNLSTDYLNIGPGKTMPVEVTILNKESLVPGGHYGALLATTEQSENQTGEKVSVVQSFGSLLYVAKTGGEKPELKFSRLLTEKMWLNLESKVQLRLQNSGNIHLVPRGLVVVKNSQGVEVARGVINAESAIILPETFRWFKFDLKSESRFLMPGRYSLVASFRYDGKNEPEMRETKFIYFGKEGLIIIAISLILFIVLIWRGKSI